MITEIKTRNIDNTAEDWGYLREAAALAAEIIRDGLKDHAFGVRGAEAMAEETLDYLSTVWLMANRREAEALGVTEVSHGR